MTEPRTLLDYFHRHADERPDRAALRNKDKDGWHDISWSRYRRTVLEAAAGLRALGIAEGDRVGILSTNRVEWLFGDLAALAVGATTVPIYPNSIPQQVEYILAHCGAKAVFVENHEQLGKVLEVRERCPKLASIVVLADESTDGEGIVGWSELIARGDGAGPEALAAVDETSRTLDPAALATIVYTSGTTGPPKGAMISHANIVAMAESLAGALDLDGEASSLSFLPLSHIAERLQGEVMAIRIGYTVNMGEGLTKVAENLVEVEPTLLVCVPRLWEKYYSRLQSTIEDAPDLRRKLFAWALKAGREAHEVRASGRRLSLPLKVREEVADKLVLSKIRDRLGMGRTKRFVSGAAPLSADVGSFFASLGIVIQEVYGQTECVGVCTYNPLPTVKFGTVGKPCPDLEVKIAQDGEILVKGGNVFMGYLDQPEATAETVVDGWLHTGDVGTFDADGYLRITDRKKDIIVTAGGKNVSPQNIENKLKNFQGISQVVVIGDKRKFLSCLVTMDVEALSEVFDREGWGPVPAEAALRTDKRVLSLVEQAIAETNLELASYETIKKFEILDKDFTVEDDELTPSLKVKRRVIQRKYEAMIDAFYKEKFA